MKLQKEYKERNQTNKTEWREIEFGSLIYFEVRKGESITRDKVTEGGVPVVAGGQQPAYYHNKSNRPGETITISGSGAYAGFVNYFKEPIFASDCSTVQIKNDLISSMYAYLFLKSYQSKIYSMQKGIAQPHVYPKDIIKIKIPLPFSNGKPNLKEQERIVSILENAEKLKERSKNTNVLLDEYLKSVFNEMFCNKDFEEVELRKTVVDKKDFVDGPFGSNLKVSHQTDEGIRLIQINNIGVGNWRDKTKKYTTEERYTKLIRHSASGGEIVIAKMGEPLGRACFVPEEINKALIVADCMRLRVTSNEFDKRYILFFLNSPYSKRQIEDMSHGSTRIRINLSMIKSLKIPVPPLDLQQKFAKIVEKTEILKENIKKSKNYSEELINSLTRKAFRGEL